MLLCSVYLPDSFMHISFGVPGTVRSCYQQTEILLLEPVCGGCSDDSESAENATAAASVCMLLASNHAQATAGMPRRACFPHRALQCFGFINWFHGAGNQFSFIRLLRMLQVNSEAQQ
jgi:hypothetical protein